MEGTHEVAFTLSDNHFTVDVNADLHASETDTLQVLFEDHYLSILRTAFLILGSREDAEDLAQEAFVRVLASLRRIQNPELAPAYLRTTLLNLCRGRIRRRTIFERKSDLMRAYIRSTQECDAGLSPSEQQVEAIIATDALSAAILRLPLRQRECIVLRYFTGLSELETASAMGISRGSAKTHHFRALAALRQTMEDLS